MRRQDEIVRLYPGADVAFRRILVDMAGDLIPAHDSYDVDALLLSGLGSPDDWTRAISSLALLNFSTFWVPAAYGIAGVDTGAWTSQLLHGGKTVTYRPRGDEASAGRRALLHRALLFHLEPLLQALAGAFPRLEGPDRALLALCLARLPSPAAVEALRSSLEATGSPEAGLGLAVCGTRSACDAYVDYLRRHPVLSDARLLVGLGSLPPAYFQQGAADAWRLLERAVASGSKDQLMAAALAAPVHPQAGESLAGTIACEGDPWASCHALMGLARSGTGLPTALRVYRQPTALPLQKVVAVWVAGRVGTQESTDFLASVASGGEANAQAFALELLSRRDRPPGPDLLTRLLRSQHWRVRLNAALLTSIGDPERAFEVLQGFVSSPADVERATGAYALAYVPEATGILVQQLDDPSPFVRQMAVASLRRHRGGDASRALARAALGEDTDVAIRALQALAWSEGVPATEIVPRFLAVLGKHPDPHWRAQVYRTAASLCARMSFTAEALERGMKSADPDEVVGCLDGMIIAGFGPGEPDALAPAVAASARVQARLGLARLLAGRSDAVVCLARQGDGGGAGLRHLLRALWRLAALVPWLGDCVRFDPLERMLLPLTRKPEYTAFSSRQLELPVAEHGATASMVDDGPQCPAAPASFRLPGGASARIPGPTSRRVARVPADWYSIPSSAVRSSGKRWPWLATGALLGVLVICVLLPRPRPPVTVDRSAHRALEPARLSVELFGSAVSGRGTAAPPIGKGQSCRVGPGERAVLTGVYPGPTLELAPGEVTIRECTDRTGRRVGCDLEVEVREGLYHVDMRPGASFIRLSASRRTFSARGARFTLQIEPRAGTVSVEKGTVQVTGPESRPVGEGLSLSWTVEPGP